MFTGIVSEIGRIEKITRAVSLIKFGIEAPAVAHEAKVSDSIAVNGVCLTVVNKQKDILFFDAIASTLVHTNLKRLKKNDYVNIESSLAVGEKLGGHFVLGHVDSEAKLRRVIKKSNQWSLEIELQPRFRKFVLQNGSIAVEGISLTIKNVLPQVFTVDIIPFTYAHTTLQYKRPGDQLNIEFDYLLKQKVESNKLTS